MTGDQEERELEFFNMFIKCPVEYLEEFWSITEGIERATESQRPEKSYWCGQVECSLSGAKLKLKVKC